MIGKIVKLVLKAIFPEIDKKIDKAMVGVFDKVAKVFKADDLLRYMELPNDADRGVAKLKSENEMFRTELKDTNNKLDETNKTLDNVIDFMNKAKKLRVFKSLGK